MGVLDGVLKLAEQFYPLWNILSHYISSFFILFTLRIFSFGYTKRHQNLILFVSAVLCGSVIDWADMLLYRLAELLSLSIPYHFDYMYMRISLISVWFIILFALLLYRGNRCLIALTALLLFNLFSAVRFLFLGIIQYFYGDADILLHLCLSEFPTCLVCTLIYWVVTRFQKEAHSGFSTSEALFWFCIAFLDMLMMCWLPILTEAWWSVVMFSINLIFTTAIIYALIFMYSREKYISTEQQKIIHNLDQSRSYLAQMKEASAHLSKVRHELKNYVFYIDELVQRQDYDALHTYLNTLKSQDLDAAHTIASGNAIVDSILNQKYAYAESLGIRASMQVNLPEKLDIDNLTLCSVLGNLLNNAVEACSGVQAPFLSVEIRPYKDYLIILVKNSTKCNVIKENPHLLTTKEDAENHGIGLKVIENLVKQYDGMLRLEMEGEDIFSACVMLKCSKPAHH